MTTDSVQRAHRALFLPRRAPQRVVDGRVRTVDEDGVWSWVGVDLACICLSREDACAHQLIAALLRDWPLAPAPDVPTVELEQLRASLDSVAGPLPLTLVQGGVRPHSSDEESMELTDPALTDERLIDGLHHRRWGVTEVLALAHARRPGPLRDLIWAMWRDRHDPAGSLARLLLTEPAATLPARLAGLAEPAMLRDALARTPDLVARLRPHLATSTVAALLADPAVDRELRLRLIRRVSAAPRPRR